jgi:hypothetical protein
MQFKCVNTSETKKILLCFSHQEMTAWPGCQRFNIIIGNVSTIPDEHILINGYDTTTACQQGKVELVAVYIKSMSEHSILLDTVNFWTQ